MTSTAPVGRVYLWRHGQTDDNAALRLQGQVDTELNARGRAQARRGASSLAAELRAADAPVRIVSSDLRRARATAQALADELDGAEVETDPQLRERAFGPWERLTHTEIEADWPEQFTAWRHGKDPDVAGIESRGDCAKRIGGAVERLAGQAEPGQSLVIVGHGAGISLAMVHLLGLEPGAWAGVRGMDNCHWAQLRPNPGREPRWVLTALNVGAVAAPLEDEEIEADVAPGTGTAPATGAGTAPS